MQVQVGRGCKVGVTWCGVVSAGVVVVGLLWLVPVAVEDAKSVVWRASVDVA